MLGAPSALGSMIASGRPPTIAVTSAAVIWPSSGLTRTNVMTRKLITVGDNVGLEAAKELLHKNRIEKLLVVDEAGRLKGLITIKDIEQAEAHPFAAKDELGRLRCGAAVGVGGDREARIDALIAAGCDVICVDTAHGHSAGVIEAVRATRKNFPKLQLVAGNVAMASASLRRPTATTSSSRARASGPSNERSSETRAMPPEIPTASAHVRAAAADSSVSAVRSIRQSGSFSHMRRCKKLRVTVLA